MSFKAYLTSKVFLKNLLLAIGITVVVLLITMWGIRLYTNHGESFAVPDFSGMELEQAEQLAAGRNLNYQVVDSLYVANVNPGAVIDQVPVSGFLVKEGRTVFLTICAKNPEQVAMPKLTDISFRQAVNIMQGAGLNVGEVTYVFSEYPNLVLSQQLEGKDIATGALVGKGSAIDLVIGKSGSGEKTVVPNLVGVTLEQAKSELGTLFLQVGAVIYDGTVATGQDSLQAKIWQQRPEAATTGEIDLGTSIDLWLTLDDTKFTPETEDTEEPENELF
ncbi:PASTA domain-containing protein [Gaoshiqia sediminis]|uniref:PASTA domain-containing protein n=1 Tax=Gaoshiqia sediminis TaxID=2986998 RepID=A0AA41YEY4_9BACT|nr:PASTA domain-containing protein [Gaoshiqia sediminis]MCW0484797.1 PASTA domain-containing protein [Gaoshiqia sediminis]